MRDLNKSIAYVERGLLRGLDRKVASLPKGMVSKPPIRAWRAPASAADVVYPIEQVFRPKAKPMPQLTLTARALKVTVPLDPAEIASMPASGQERIKLAIACEGKLYTADIATKSLRKAQATIAASGAVNVFAMVQGKLKGSEIVECGLVAQIKTPKPPAVEATTVG
jgi:hypothetical protein